MFLFDNETKVDLLNNEPIAASIVALLRDNPSKPMTIGVHGDWGAGKSSILEMIENQFATYEDTVCLKFNGWRFQGFEDAKIALIEGIVTALVEKRPALTKAGDAVKDIFGRIDWLKLAKHAGGLALTATNGIPSPDMVGALFDKLKDLAADPAKLATKENLDAAAEGAKGLIKPSSKRVPEEIEAFRKEFDELLNKAGIKQLVILIDDLDRCLPDTAIETLEAVRLFLFTSNTAFVVAADEAMIEYSVRKHFPDLPDSTGPRDYARNYLEKLIQVPFRIPALGDVETRSYVTLLLVGAEIGEDHPGFQTLIEKAREALREPWKGGGVDAALLNTSLGDLGDKGPAVVSALTLSDQIGPLLGRGTFGNPRQIKRFLNALLLREHTARNRKFGEDFKRTILAKLMLAERFIPRLFEQVATDAARDEGGVCRRLAKLEAGPDVPPTAADDTEPKTSNGAARRRAGAEAAPEPPAAADQILDEWRVDERVTEWAKLEPKLAGVDLRPYLFIARDRKDFFGAASTLGHLEGVVDMLMLPRIAIQSTRLKELAPAEASKVFEGVRQRIMSSDDFRQKPKGVEGLVILVTAQPALQPNLLDFIEQLPADRCGPWLATGWNAALTSQPSKDRLTQIQDGWAKQDGNTALKAAAGAGMTIKTKAKS
ncbi:NTPase KAP [Sphingomonas sp. CL5.1]|uniref:Qat anti-phage system ATPase QatA n=1 Tax=Sphingomonas sp. CL5.1 TaxID=2653203 RepID=UPI001582417E|nr:Qat anti-phage system ATPase QatA [Sphingomonas sp. CL5.1]MBN8840935.1 NTPase KAP [Sphingomonadales bacterium]QKR99238.1 NTPase KAP [Sphingomonas sp. CL5.1]